MKSVEIMKTMMHPYHSHKVDIKSWGWEYWFENNKKYCGKIINVQGGKWSSYGAFHYHKIKDETFLVIDGTLILDLLVPDIISKNRVTLDKMLLNLEPDKNVLVNRCYLKPFQYLRLVPGVLHRFSSLTDECTFTETSTTHMEHDSYRISDPTPEEQLEYEIQVLSGHTLPAKTDKFSVLLAD